MASKIDSFISQSAKNGMSNDDMYRYQPRKQIENINESTFRGYTPTPVTNPRSFDVTPTLEVEREREVFNDLYDNVLSLYAQSNTGEAINGANRYAVDSMIATALGKDYTEVASNHKYYVRAITGADMEDDTFLKAFADNFSSYWTQRGISWKQLMFDFSNDEDEKKQLLKDIEELEQKLIKKQDYRDRGFIAKNVVASAPILNQIAESLLLTFGGAAVGGAVAGLANGTLSGASAISQIAIGVNRALPAVSAISKGARVASTAGAIAGGLNTYALETGSLSRELYNMVDNDGNRISDNIRRTVAGIGGALIALEEYITPDPVAGFAKIGKFPKNEAKKSFKKWVVSYGLHRLADANSESFEEAVQSFTGALAKDIAKYYSDKAGNTSFGSEGAVDNIRNALTEGWESYKDTFMPMMVTSFVPGTIKDATTLRRSIQAGHDAQMHTKNSAKAKKEAWKWQKENTTPNVISMDLIDTIAEKPNRDFGKSTVDGKEAEKLDKINVVPNPYRPEHFVGATSLDDNKLKWAFNKGFKAVDVNILESADPTIDMESLANLSKQYNGGVDNSTKTVVLDSEESLNEFKKDIEALGINVEDNGKSFTIKDSDTNQKITVQLATNETKKDADVIAKSDGIIKNRDFVTELRNALTANGQLETTMTDTEIDVVSNLVGMFGNDITERVQFLSAFDEGVSDKEAKSLGDARGITSFRKDAERSARIILNSNADATTVVHEMFHVALKYNQNARNNLVKTINKELGKKNGKKDLKKFLSEHPEEMKSAGFNSADDLMNVLYDMTTGNVLSDSKKQEALDAMFEMFYNSDSLGKENAPEGIRKLFKELSDIFAKIYKNVTGKTLMPKKISEAYAGFFGVGENNNSFNNEIGLSQILKQRNISKEQFFKELSDKSRYTQYQDSDVWIDNERYKQLSSESSKQDNKKLKNEIKSALAFSKEFNREVFLLNERLEDDYYSITNGKNPDAIADFRILELKNTIGGDNALKKSLSDAASQSADIIYININKDSAVANNFEKVLNGKIQVSDSLDGRVIVFSVDYNNFKSFLINKKEKLVIASPWSARILEASLRRGYQNDSDTQNVNENSDSVNNEILQQKNITPEQKVIKKADEKDKKKEYKFSQFSETDVKDMIEAGIFVPDVLLDKYPQSEAVMQEKLDRSAMSAFLEDNAVRRALAETTQVAEFLETAKKYLGDAYTSDSEQVLRKIFAYSKVQTPAQMRKSFRNEYGTGNIDKLMELKAMVSRRTINKISKQGYAYSQIYVPDTARTYNLIKNLDRTSSQKEIDAVVDSINKNTGMWLRDYLKATQMDYAKHFTEAEVGSKDYLKAKSELMYLAFGEDTFSLVKDIRNASRVEVYSEEEKATLKALEDRKKELKKAFDEAVTKEDRSDIKAEQKETNKEYRELRKEGRERREDAKNIKDTLNEKSSTKSGVTALELERLFFDDMLDILDDKQKAELQKLKEWEERRIAKRNETIEGLKQDKRDIRTEYRWKLLLMQEDSKEKREALKNKLDDKITRLEIELLDLQDEKRDIKQEARQKVKDAYNESDRREKELKAHSKKELGLTKMFNELDKKAIINEYKARIANLKALQAELKARNSLKGQIKRRLNVDHSIYSASVDESAMWIYSLMHDKEKMSDADYDTYATKKGLTTEDDRLIFFDDVDADTDGDAVDRQYEFDPNAYNFNRAEIPSALLEYGFSDDALADLSNPNIKFSQLDSSTLKELNDAFATAKAKAKAQKAVMDAEKATRRVKVASEIYSSILGEDGSLPSNVRDMILQDLGFTLDDYNNSTAVQAKVFKNFTDNISRYSDVLQRDATKGNKLMGWVANTIGHIQWVADYIESDKNGPIHDLFVNQAQKALNSYETNKTARTAKALSDMVASVGGQERWNEIYKSLCKDDTVDISYTVRPQEGGYGLRAGKINYNQALGIYIYAMNAQSFGNLINSKGNNFSLETIASINPEYMKIYLEKELENFKEYGLNVSKKMDYYQEKHHLIPEYQSLFFQTNTIEEVQDVYNKLQSGQIQSAVPQWVKDLGDAIVKTLNGDNGENTRRLEKFSAEVLNSPFRGQLNYFPKVANDVQGMNSIGEVMGTQTKHVSTNALKDRQSAFNYALRLDPINTLFGAIEAQERMMNMYEVVSDMNYVMGDKGFNTGAIIESAYGRQMKKYIDSQIASLAGNKMILSDFEKTANKVLQNVAVSKIGFNAMTSVKQFISAIPAITNSELSASDFLKGIALMSGNEKESMVSMYNKYASDVAGGSLGYEYTLLRQRTEVTGTDTFMGKLTEKAMQWTETADQLAKKWVFAAAYDKFTKQGMTSEQAGLKAVEIIKKTQSIGDAYSLSNFERNRSPFVRAFAMFSKDQFQVWNSIMFGMGTDLKTKDYKAFAEKALGIGLITLSTALLAGGWLPDEDEEGFDLEAFLSDFYTNLVGYVPVFGTFFTDDQSDSLLTEPFKKAKETIEGVVKLGNNIAGGAYEASDWNPIINSAIDAIGATGLPSVQMKRGIKMVAPNGLIGEDKAFNPGWLFGKFGANTYNLLF